MSVTELGFRDAMAPIASPWRLYSFGCTQPLIHYQYHGVLSLLLLGDLHASASSRRLFWRRQGVKLGFAEASDMQNFRLRARSTGRLALGRGQDNMPAAAKAAIQDKEEYASDSDHITLYYYAMSTTFAALISTTTQTAALISITAST